VAVYERVWRPYAGPVTPVGRRFLVVTRYALAEAFSSRLFTAFYAACFLPSLLSLGPVNSSRHHQVPLTHER